MDLAREFVVLREMVERVKADLGRLERRDDMRSYLGGLYRMVGSRIWNDMQSVKRELRRSGYWVGLLQERGGHRTYQVVYRGRLEVVKVAPDQFETWIEDRAKQYAQQLEETARNTEFPKVSWVVVEP